MYREQWRASKARLQRHHPNRSASERQWRSQSGCQGSTDTVGTPCLVWVEYKYSSLESGVVSWIVCQSVTQPIRLWSHLFWLKFRDSPHPLQGESRYSQHQRRVWSDGSSGWIRLSVSTCTIIGQSQVISVVISPAYLTIRFAYQLRSLGMTGFWEGSADRSHNMHHT